MRMIIIFIDIGLMERGKCHKINVIENGHFRDDILVFLAVLSYINKNNLSEETTILFVLV
jgi:hypothetical protein